ncbi:hypothetical protein ACFDTO_27950 [Microbacteriaceae bacterium 4G12]
MERVEYRAEGSEADGLATDALLPRLEEIVGRPLNQRASALAELHDELRARLEGGDAAAARG